MVLGLGKGGGLPARPLPRLHPHGHSIGAAAPGASTLAGVSSCSFGGRSDSVVKHNPAAPSLQDPAPQGAHSQLAGELAGPPQQQTQPEQQPQPPPPPQPTHSGSSVAVLGEATKSAVPALAPDRLEAGPASLGEQKRPSTSVAQLSGLSAGRTGQQAALRRKLRAAAHLGSYSQQQEAEGAAQDVGGGSRGGGGGGDAPQRQQAAGELPTASGADVEAPPRTRSEGQCAAASEQALPEGAVGVAEPEPASPSAAHAAAGETPKEEAPVAAAAAPQEGQQHSQGEAPTQARGRGRSRGRGRGQRGRGAVAAAAAAPAAAPAAGEEEEQAATPQKRGREGKKHAGQHHHHSGKFADLIGKIVEVPAEVFSVDIPDFYYRGVITKREGGRKQDALEVRFLDDNSKYWFPVESIRGWLADMGKRGAAPSGGEGDKGVSVGGGADAFAAEVLTDILASGSSMKSGRGGSQVSDAAAAKRGGGGRGSGGGGRGRGGGGTKRRVSRLSEGGGRGDGAVSSKRRKQGDKAALHVMADAAGVPSP